MIKRCIAALAAIVMASTGVSLLSPPTAAHAALTYLYAGGRQTGVTADGAWANFSVHKPTLASGDFHTLAEMSAQSATGGQFVEVGWTVDTVGGQPKLFVARWLNGVFGGYNTGGWVDYAPTTLNAGDSLASWVGGTSIRFIIQYSSGNWWIAADTAASPAWLGYFPGTIWSSVGVTFTTANNFQLFDEMAVNTSTSCTDGGSGVLASAGPPAVGSSIGSFSLINSTSSPVLTTFATDSTHWASVALSARTIRVGGPGFC